MVEVYVDRLLSTTSSIGLFVDWAIFVKRCRYYLYDYFTFLKFVIKSNSLLLEDRRGETGNEGNNQPNTLFLNPCGPTQSLNWPKERKMARKKWEKEEEEEKEEKAVFSKSAAQFVLVWYWRYYMSV